MNKLAIQKFAVEARRDLLRQVKQQAYNYEIDEDGYGDENAKSVRGIVLTDEKVSQRKALINKIKKIGYEKVMDTVAYTWFNRFIALRYMEVNDFLPSRIRVLSNDNGEFKPDILTRALEVDFAGINKDLVIELKSDPTKEEDLYRYLFLAQCNALNNELPYMFEKIGSYTELLLPLKILNDESVIARLVNDIDEMDFTEAVEIVGWLFQYYNTERKNEVINIYKGTIKKDDIPSATQLFTTNWVVKYMVDNSLGRYWIERNPQSNLKNKLDFFVMPKNDEIQYIDEEIKPEDLTFFDPCMGSGHILVYAFEVLIEIYKECGYSERESAKLIVEKNLYGIDIDDRAYELAYFAVMMKARSYDRRFLTRNIEPNVVAIQETNNLDETGYLDLDINIDEYTKNCVLDMLTLFKYAKEVGSLVTVENIDFKCIENFINSIESMSSNNLFLMGWYKKYQLIIKSLIKQSEILCNKYNIVCTNPPYLNKMEGELKSFVTKNYKDYSNDLFSVFIYKNFQYCKENGYSAFMTPFVWMFIKSYEKLRDYILENKSITTLVQMEYSAFEEATVPICSFVLKKSRETTKGLYFRLEEFKGGMEVQKVKVLEGIKNKDCGYFYESSQGNFSKIPGSPIAYWVSEKMFYVFDNSKKLGEIALPKQGLATADNNRFLRMWNEVNNNNICYNAKNVENSVESKKKWFPYNKGGKFRKWYGNNDFIINWENDGEAIRDFKNSVTRNTRFYFDQCISWSLISSSSTAFRYKPHGFIFDVAGMSCFTEPKMIKYLLGLNNTKLVNEILKILAPTINYQVGDIANIPVIYSKENEADINNIVDENMSISKTDWDSFETSWDFKSHPLLKGETIAQGYKNWEKECTNRFNQLKANEEELNKIFIEIYGLQDELTPEVADKDVTVSLADLQRDIKSFISYGVGCIFGRYSLDVEGLAFAGGDFDLNMYYRFKPDKDNVVPICDDEYFNDDIVNRFVDFVKIIYSEDTLEENLDFIADALNKKGDNPRQVIRNYFLNDFYKDHLKTYQKRPIYWLFDSGKKNGFKGLIYIHRYKKDLMARVRIDYVHEQQERYISQLKIIEDELLSASQREKSRLNKLEKKFKDQVIEVKAYEENIKHLADLQIIIDLDDGVVNNYNLFSDILAK
ncbi:MAG: BREX-1 system adenine-specific DNA-methyltransferase PglX [Lachnospirales bacterium]